MASFIVGCLHSSGFAVKHLAHGLYFLLRMHHYCQSITKKLALDVLNLNHTAQILAVTEEAAFPDSNRYLDVFNDTSIHQFPREKLDAKPKEFWEGAAEPMYQQCEDLEIIQNG